MGIQIWQYCQFCVFVKNPNVRVRVFRSRKELPVFRIGFNSYSHRTKMPINSSRKHLLYTNTKSTVQDERSHRIEWQLSLNLFSLNRCCHGLTPLAPDLPWSPLTRSGLRFSSTVTRQPSSLPVRDLTLNL